MQDRLTTYFQQHHAWTPDWHRIRLIPNGWALRAGSILCPDNDATTIALPGRYEIHYREGIPESVMAHELQHIRDMERLGTCRYVRQYAMELLTKGYRNISFEISARNVANEYNKRSEER